MKRVKIILPALLGLMTIPAMAQETYQDAKLAETALTGTARYVGMGGAMEALGADLSTISTNPAGIGMFRKCWRSRRPTRTSLLMAPMPTSMERTRR